MKNIRIICYVLTAFVLGLAAIPGKSIAMDLDTAKTAGYVGEQPDGLLGVVKQTPDGEVVRLVNEINAKRMEKYRELAAKRGVSVESVMHLTGEHVIEQARKGAFIKDANGQWTRK